MSLNIYHNGELVPVVSGNGSSIKTTTAATGSGSTVTTTISANTSVDDLAAIVADNSYALNTSKQNATDNTLTTTSKAIVGAINELNAGNSANDTNTPWYATCPTAASTTAKVATSSDNKFALSTGAKVQVKFTYKNTATAPKLNVDSTGAKTIYGYGTTVPGVWWEAGDVVEFTYNGTNWIMGATSGQITLLNTNLTELSQTISSDSSGLPRIKTTTFPSDGSILDTFSATETYQTVFNSDGSISEIYTKDGNVIEHKTIFNSDGSISVVDVPQT